MTHPWADGFPLTVTVDAEGAPTQLVWGGQKHRITRIFKRWQLDVDWWRAQGPVRQRCFLVYTNHGLVCIIGDTGDTSQPDETGEQEWRLLRIFD